jgi:hypothetical protein
LFSTISNKHSTKFFRFNQTEPQIGLQRSSTSKNCSNRSRTEKRNRIQQKNRKKKSSPGLDLQPLGLDLRLPAVEVAPGAVGLDLQPLDLKVAPGAAGRRRARPAFMA